MIRLPFAKVDGAGNDFVVLEGAPPSVGDAEPLVRWMCHRRRGVGADGAMWLQRQDATAPRDIPRVSIHFFNCDGTPFQLCINGSRAAALYAAQRGWGEGAFVLRTPVGDLDARVDGNQVRLRIPPPRLLGSAAVALPPHSLAPMGYAVDTGDPHLVVELEEPRFAALDVAVEGARLRRWTGAFPQGSNVHFIVRGAPEWSIRTFERGIEGETLACGSGCLSAVLALAGGESEPIAFRTGGGDVVIVTPGPKNWQVEGPAAVACEGTLLWDGRHAP